MEKFSQMKLVLKEDIVKQANTIENMINNCINGFLQRKPDLLKAVTGRLEAQVNENEILIEEYCIKLIALYRPEAKDLRTLLMLLKLNSDLEKIGDHCVNIAESSLIVIQEVGSADDYSHINQIALEAQEMVSESITAFLNEDNTLSREICCRDQVVDKLLKEYVATLIDALEQKGNKVDFLLNMMRIAQNFEKIADLATDICEEAVYAACGKVIKHHWYKTEVL